MNCPKPPILTLLGTLIIGLAAVYFEQSLDFLFGRSSSDSFAHVFSRVAPPSNPVVSDSEKHLTYVGSSGPGVEHFQNIFYAHDTSGKNRFAPPKSRLPQPGSVIDATRPGAWCPQGIGDILPFTSKVVNVSEDCLSLRITRPAGTTHDSKLPVLVWVHGGML